MKIKIITTGGTFDKVYFDALNEFRFGQPAVGALLDESNVSFAYRIESLMQKDSLEMIDDDRRLIRGAVERTEESRVLIIHGTDTMIDCAQYLAGITGKTVVLFGAMQPARMRHSDALFNLGFAAAAVQLLPQGIYLAMNGRVFDPHQVAKNREQGRFVSLE